MVLPRDIENALRILKRGGLVAMPTETVYGLAADARNPEALQKIFKAKQRPTTHPLIVHISDLSQLNEWAREIPDVAFQLAEAFWPGPLTMILKKAQGVSDWITGGQDTIGIRMPSHPVARQLLQAAGGGLAAPSANRFGRISPTTADAVKEELGDAVDLVLEGGSCEVGVESTIVDLSSDVINILRPGMITEAAIAKIVQQPIGKKTIVSPRVSGSHESHYAPETTTELLSQTELLHVLQHLSEKELPLAVISYSLLELPKTIYHVSMPTDANEYAKKLYAVLRAVDKKQFKKILIEAVPDKPEWDGIRDRLQRASK